MQLEVRVSAEDYADIRCLLEGMLLNFEDTDAPCLIEGEIGRVEWELKP